MLGCLVLGALSSGCSDDVSAAPEGAFYVDWRPVSGTTSGHSCTVTGHQTQRGGVDSNEFTLLYPDTVEGAQVFCAVSSNGGGYAVDAEMNFQNAYLSVSVAEISQSNTRDNPARGAVAYQSAETAVTFYSHPEAACLFYVEEGSKEEVSDGRVWVTFECPDMAAGMQACQIDQSYLAFQNCEQ